MRRSWVLLVVGACGFSPHAGHAGDGGGGGDEGSAVAPVDALSDTPPGLTCFGALALDRVCYPDGHVPGTDKTYALVVQTINTDDGPTCNGNAMASPIPGDPCIVAYASIAVNSSTLTVSGSHPLILLATGPDGIVVDKLSTLDASSHLPQVGAATLAATACPGGAAATAHGGGYGGSFLDLGGDGGDDDQGHGHAVAAPVLGPPGQLHGGCPGSPGGNNSFTAATAGGGAIALVAAKLQVEGTIAAGGDGGKGSSTNNAGGDGGGAGGMIVLDAPNLTGTGEVTARGGGGGEGRGGLTPFDGAPGYDPINRTLDGKGGAGGGTGGDGGDGWPRLDATSVDVRTGAAGGTGASAAGGGGGGGAAGVIKASATTLPPGIQFTPPPS